MFQVNIILKDILPMNTLGLKKRQGGGILMAVKKELSPDLVRDGGEEVEALTVDIFVKKNRYRLYYSLWGPGRRLKRKKGNILAIFR